MSANDRALLDLFLEDRRPKIAPDMSREDFFELFVAEQVVWDHNLSWEELQDGVVDGGDDGGIDCVFGFLNGELLVEGGTKEKLGYWTLDNSVDLHRRCSSTRWLPECRSSSLLSH